MSWALEQRKRDARLVEDALRRMSTSLHPEWYGQVSTWHPPFTHDQGIKRKVEQGDSTSLSSISSVKRIRINESSYQNEKTPKGVEGEASKGEGSEKQGFTKSNDKGEGGEDKVDNKDQRVTIKEEEETADDVDHHQEASVKSEVSGIKEELMDEREETMNNDHSTSSSFSL